MELIKYIISNSTPWKAGDFEPIINSQIMQKHINIYEEFIQNLNINISKYNIEEPLSQEKLLNNSIEEVKKNAQGFFNHKFFLNNLSNYKQKPTKLITELIDNSFANFENFKKQFSTLAQEQSAESWIWLLIKLDGNLEITVTHNNESPSCQLCLDQKSATLLVIDLWEYAYIDQYKCIKKYISACWDIIDWKTVEARYYRFISKKQKIYEE